MLIFFRFRYFVVAILSLVAISCLPAVGQEDCVLRKDKDSIQVYTCKAETSRFRSIKATFTVAATLTQMAAFLLDAKNYYEWQYNTVASSVLKKISEREIIYHTEISAPWPVSNRDMVVRLQVVQDPKTRVLTVSSSAVPDYIPERDHFVRVPSSQARWIVYPLAPHLLRVEYSIMIDPGGSVPAWMVNMVSAQAPYDSFRS